MLKREELTRLVQKAQQMDPDAMNALFEDCRDPIYYFALKTVGNADIAEDITQEAMIDIFRNLDKLKDPAAFQAWSREITYRQCLHHIKKTPETTVSEDEDGHSIFDTLEEENTAFIPDAAVENEDFRKTVHAMIDSLPAEQRAALLLFHFDDLSIKEIAQIQQVSENTVKSRLNYARKAVKSSVEDYEKKNGIKLHSFAIAPFLAWLLVTQASAATMPAAAAATTAVGVSAATGVSLSAASGTTAGAATAGTAVAAATKAAVPLAVKITAGVAAAGIVAGGVAVGAGLMKKDEPKERPLRPLYESAHMEIYAQSDRYQEAFAAILGDETADYILTEDNEVYAISDPETNVLEGKDVKEAYVADLDLYYVDSDGVTHVFYDDEDVPLTGLEGRVILYRSGLLGGGYFYTLNGNNLQITELDEETKEVISANADWALFEESPEANSDINSIRCRSIFVALGYDTIVFADSKNAQTFATLSPGYSPRYAPRLPDGTEVTVERCLSMPVSSMEESPLVTIEGDDRHIYYCQTLSHELDICLELPDNRTTDELQQALFDHRILLLFTDGTVYEENGETFEKIEPLSDIGKGGHIERLYRESISSDRLLVLMDDDVLYQYIHDPQPIDENIEKIKGTYKGSYEPSQGETGLTLTVMRKDGRYQAKFEFYSLPGKDNSESGSYYTDVSYDEETETYRFHGREWIDQPGGYIFADLAGSLDGQTLAGEDPTEFSVKRISD